MSKKKSIVAWAVLTKGGRIRPHIYRHKTHAKRDSIPEWGDKIVRVEVRLT